MFNSNSCAMCRHPITDPVCRGCYIKQTRVIMQDLKISYIIKDFVSAKIKKSYPIETINDTSCILCKKDTVSICRYCFSLVLIRILREINFPESLIKNFRDSPMYDESSAENTYIALKIPTIR